jgi:hypothetical protein
MKKSASTWDLIGWRGLGDVVDTELDYPFGDSPSHVPIEDDIRQRGRSDDLDEVLVEVRASRCWA